MSRIRLLLFRILVGAMLAAGLIEDIDELFLDEWPWATPDRLFAGPDYLAIAERGGIWSLAGVVPGVLDFIITILLVVAGVYLVRAVGRRTGLWPCALLIGLAVLDDVWYLPEELSSAYFSLYWPLLFACFLWLGAVFPRRLARDDLPVRESGIIRRWLRTVDRVWLRAPVLWGVTFITAVSYLLLEPEPEEISIAQRAIAITWILMILLWIRAGVRFVKAQYRLAIDEERRRIRWFLTACVTYLMGFAILFLVYLMTTIYVNATAATPGAIQLWVDFATASAYQILVLVAVVLLILAIFRGGALDPAWVVRRVNVYYASAVAAIFLFTLAEDMFAAGLERLLPLPPNMVRVVILSATVTLVLGPLKVGLERLSDRLAVRWAPMFESTAVLLVTDIVGYSDLMASDRGRALNVLHRLRAAARAVAGRHGGRVAHARADTLLLAFQEARDALKAAARLGAELRRVTSGTQGPAPRLRTTVHRGKVLPLRRGELLGDGVTEAFRLHAETPPGEVWVSRSVVQALPGPADRARVVPLEKRAGLAAGLASVYRLHDAPSREIDMPTRSRRSR